MARPAELRHAAGYRAAIEEYLAAPGLCWESWIAISPDGACRLPRAGEPYSPASWEVHFDMLVLYRPLPVAGKAVRQQWREELERRLSVG